jgi:glycosyltransferase involved in cell wall biosynthesis
MRYATIKDGRISLISDNLGGSNTSDVLVVPDGLDDIKSSDIIASYRIVNGKFKSKVDRKSASQLKVAIVSNFMMACGISGYCEKLLSALGPKLGEYKLFVEEDEHPTGPITENHTICWKRGKEVSSLIKNIKEYEPDVVLINHEFGLFPNAVMWLSLMSQLQDYRVIVIMHSVFRHLDKLICEAAMPEIIVHLDAARDVLRSKGVLSKISIVPHGCDQQENKEKLWNYYGSKNTFIQQGYGFRYKAFELSIRAVAILKEKYNDVFFTALFSESKYAKFEHQMYYNELSKLITELKLENNVAIIRGFQSDGAVDSYFRTNNVAVFPYISNKDHECFASSGAVRTAMTKGIPVISSNIHHFSDAPTIKANTPEEIASELDKLFSDQEYRKKQIELQNEFLKTNSWLVIADKYVKILEED